MEGINRKTTVKAQLVGPYLNLKNILQVLRRTSTDQIPQRHLRNQPLAEGPTAEHSSFRQAFYRNKISNSMGNQKLNLFAAQSKFLSVNTFSPRCLHPLCYSNLFRGQNGDESCAGRASVPKSFSFA